jgi:hypothetical protein
MVAPLSVLAALQPDLVFNKSEPVLELKQLVLRPGCNFLAVFKTQESQAQRRCNLVRNHLVFADVGIGMGVEHFVADLFYNIVWLVSEVVSMSVPTEGGYHTW